MSEIWTPRVYQDHGLDFVLDTPDCGLWLPMGLGKTSIAATAIMTCLYDTFDVRRVLIVAPKRVASKVWPDEFAKWKHLAFMQYRVLSAADFGLTPGYQTVDVYEPVLETIRKKQKKGKLTFGWDSEDDAANRKAKAACKKRLQSYTERIHIVSWDFLEYLVDAYGVNWPYEMVVLDESSFIKSQDTNRFRACRDFRKHTGRIVQLTGTPATNGLLNIWSQLWILDKGKRLGETYSAYRSAYFTPAATGRDGTVYSWAIDKGAKEKIYGRIGDIVMSLRAQDWITLPSVIDNPVYIDLPEKARDMYDTIERDLVAMMKGSTVSARNPAALVNKLMQIANGTVYDDGRKPVHVHDEKLKALAEIAESQDGNLLVFYAYKPEAEAIQKFFGKKAVKLDTDAKMDEWNKGHIKIAYSHAASIGYGSNIQKGGNKVVWYSPTHNLEHWQQANARLVRSGQEADHVIQSCIMATDTLDRHVRYRVLADKEADQQSLMDAVLARIGEL
jgi:SNF2 family DNA or RNA helicase